MDPYLYLDDAARQDSKISGLTHQISVHLQPLYSSFTSKRQGFHTSRLYHLLPSFLLYIPLHNLLDNRLTNEKKLKIYVVHIAKIKTSVLFLVSNTVFLSMTVSSSFYNSIFTTSIFLWIRWNSLNWLLIIGYLPINDFFLWGFLNVGLFIVQRINCRVPHPQKRIQPITTLRNFPAAIFIYVIIFIMYCR